MTDDLARLTAALADRYAIERELGQGGMATVYLANDQKHGRSVALKVLRPELGDTLGAERFLREVRLAARLSHPHILPLFDSGEADGLLYYVMPNVEGQSVRDRLDAGGPLPVDEAVRIAQEVAGALDYAHRHGVVHRDIKPENIMLQDGHALVADFGIGKALADVEGAAVTQTGISLGTPAYMSPEQAAGEGVDGRSDLYSLGCMLYEMLVGEQPFTGPTVQAVIAKRFVQTPADVTALREGVPRPVARALQRLLSRTPIDRFETGALFIAALAESADAPVVPATPENSIAVLPFTSLSRTPDDEFFADGVTEEILNALSQVPGLRVAGRSSSFSFKGRNEDLRTVGSKLNVAAVLEGTLRRSGTRIRITVQLTDTNDGYQLWSERYDRVMEDVFELQDEIAGAIANRMRLSLGKRRGAAPTKHLGAYELYLKGRALLYRRGMAIKDALECFRQAVALDPEYAEPWAGIADAYTVGAHGSLFRPTDVMPQALDAARRALALAPDLAEAHCALGSAALLFAHDYALADRSLRRALELKPTYPQALVFTGLWYLQWTCGNDRAGRDLLLRLHDLDPLSAYANTCLAFSNLVMCEWDDAVKNARRGVELDPASFLAQWALVVSLECQGNRAAAATENARALAMSNRHTWALITEVSVLAGMGQREEAQAAYRELTARRQTEYVTAAMFAVAVQVMEGVEAALPWVTRAIEEHDPSVLGVMRGWPPFAPLRASPHFADVVRPLKLPADSGSW